MPSIVQLKRSALSGKVPGTGSLDLGELAVNTYDGKIYFKKSGSIQSIESVVTTNSTITGSIRLEGTGSFGSLKVNDTLTVNHGISVISGSLGITSDLTVLGAVNAKQFNISVISSSILFESGSSKFGNSLDDTHNFTGSVNITGSFLLNGQVVGGGTTSGSFTGSFTGDGSGLRGVVSDDLPIDGWDYDSNSSASISEFNNESRKYLIDFQWEEEVGTPIGFKTFISNVTGSSQIVPTEAGIKFIVGNQQVALVGPNGIESVPPAGTVSGSSQLTSSYDQRYVLSGSITQTTWDNIASKPNGIVSGSSQVIEILTPLNSKTGSYATTGSNTFVGTQTLSGSIIPATDNAYDLGSTTYQWRDIYVSSGSLYIDGTKVLGSTGNELQITTDEGQSIKILEAGSDSIILQSADGDIQLKTSGGGNLLFDPTTGLIDVRGTLQIQDGNKITSSGGNGIVFGNNIVVSGSFESTGNINGINLTTLSSSIASTFLNQNTATSSYETKGRGIVSGSSQITFSGISSLPTLVSGSSQITYANISSIPSDIVSGSSQITLSSTTGFTTYSTSVDSRITTEKGRVDAILLASDADKDTFTEIVALINSVDTSNDSTFASFYTASVGRLNNLETTSASVNTSVSNLNTFSGSALTRLSALEVETANLESFTSSINTTIKTRLNAETVISGSSQVVGILSSLNTYTGSNDTTNTAQNSRLTTIESATGSYETKGRSIVSGSSQITLASTTGFGTYINQAVLTTSSPTFVSVTGTITESGTGDNNAPFRFSADYSGWMSHVAGTPGSNNGWGLFWAGNSGAQYGTNGTGGPGNIWSNSGNPNEYVFVGSGQTNMSIHGNTGNVWIGGELRVKGDVLPNTNNTHNLGSASLRWANLYTNDLHLSNEGKVGGNEVDGTTGNWTIQEGQEHLYIINNKTGKKFKFSLEEIQ
jgi:hypothetical protein